MQNRKKRLIIRTCYHIFGNPQIIFNLYYYHSQNYTLRNIFFLSISTSKVLFISKNEWATMVPIVKKKKKIWLPAVFSCKYVRLFNALHFFLFIIILISDHFNNFRLKFPIVCSKFFLKKKIVSLLNFFEELRVSLGNLWTFPKVIHLGNIQGRIWILLFPQNSLFLEKYLENLSLAKLF